MNNLASRAYKLLLDAESRTYSKDILRQLFFGGLSSHYVIGCAVYFLLALKTFKLSLAAVFAFIHSVESKTSPLKFCLVFEMTKLICMQALVHSANRYRYEPINWNRLSIPDAVLDYSPTSFGLCQRTYGTGLSSMQQLAEPLFILHCVFLHLLLDKIKSVVEDSYPFLAQLNALNCKLSCCNNW